VGRPLSDLQHQLEYPELEADAARVLEKLSPIEREVNSAHGRNFIARVLPYRTGEDRISGIVLTFVDITERNANAAALRESEERFRSLVSHSATGIAQVSLGGDVLFVNDRLAEMLADTPESLAGKNLGQIAARDEERNAALFRRLVIEGESFHSEQRLRRADGTEVWASVSASPMRDEQARVTSIVMVFVDITARREAEEAALRQLDELSRFNDAAVGRELRVIELKKEINDLCAQAGKESRYKVDFDTDPPANP
jgi:two-component system CheB/CheR fusion protein